MAWTPPTKFLKEPELLNDKRFYRLLSAQTNFIDDETTMLFYTGLTVLIADELQKHKFVRLPNLGDFALIPQKPRPAWLGRLHAVIGSREILKFYPKYRFRRYFNKKQGFPRYDEIMPPPPIR